MALLVAEGSVLNEFPGTKIIETGPVRLSSLSLQKKPCLTTPFESCCSRHHVAVRARSQMNRTNAWLRPLTNLQPLSTGYDHALVRLSDHATMKGLDFDLMPAVELVELNQILAVANESSITP